jgi:hypothetical protein
MTQSINGQKIYGKLRIRNAQYDGYLFFFPFTRLKSRWVKIDSGAVWKKRNNACPHSGDIPISYAARRRSCLRGLRGDFVRRLDHFVHELFEFSQPGGRNDDGIAATADVLSNSEKAPARIFLQRKNKVFPFYLDLTTFERVFYNLWPGLRIFRRSVGLTLTLVWPTTVG